MSKFKMLEVINNNKNIIGFTGDNQYLSNFYECKISSFDFGKVITFNSSEAMFHSFKCPDMAEKFEGLSAGESKKLGRRIHLREDWEEIKIACMEHCLRYKFDQHPELKWKLICTGSGHLEEANTWGDKFWGTVNGEGQNNLGKLLMKLREEYQKQYIYDSLKYCKS